MACWFCGVIEEDPKKTLNLKLYGEIDAKTQDSITKVKYMLHNVNVPRCHLCRSKHRLAFLAFTAGILLVLTAAVVAVISAFGVITGYGAGLLTGISIGMAIGGFALSRGIQKGIHTVFDARRDHPEVKALVDKGYKFGKGIKDHTREVKPSDSDDLKSS